MTSIVRRRDPAALFLLLLTSIISPAFAGEEPALVVGQRFTVPSAVLGEDRTIFVSTPGGEPRPAAAHPVLYLTDAETQFFHTAATVEFLSRNGRIPRMIVVAVANTDRARDLTPTKGAMPRPDGQAMPFPTAGGADAFLRFFETELIPFVESRYRTQPYRIFAGHSFGGLFALHAFATKPDLFNAVIAVSPSLIWDDGLPVREIDAMLASRSDLKRNLFVTLGDEGPDLQAAWEALGAVLRKRRPEGFEADRLQLREEDHGSIVLRSHYAALERIFRDWTPPRDPATGAIGGGIEGARAHYRKLSERLGYTVPIPEAVVNRIGYNHLQAKRIDDAIAVFLVNVEAHPDSPNVHDSLGEAYEAAGRPDLARASYETAVRLGEASKDPGLATYRRNAERLRPAAGGF